MARRPLLLQLACLASSGYVTEGLFMVRGLVAAHLLGPAAFGMWAAIRLVLLFSSYTDVGANAAMVQCAPQAEGAGALRRAEMHRRVASATTLAGAAVMAALVAGVLGGWVPGEVDRHVWWLVAAVVLVKERLTFYEEILASRRLFGWLAISESSFAVLSTVACIVGAWWMGLEGFLLGLGGAYLLVLLMAYSVVGPSFPAPVWRWRHAVWLILTGWPIVLGQSLSVLMWNVDKLMLWWLSTSETLGVYAIQSYFAAAVMLLPGAVAEVVLPHLRWRLGQSRQTGAGRSMLLEGTTWLAYVSLPVIGLGFLLLHLPIRWLLPAYADAIEPGRVMMLVSYFAIVATLAGTVLVALAHHRAIMLIRGLSTALAAAAVAWVLLAGGGLAMVAAAMAVGFVVHAVLLIGVAWRATHCTAGQGGALLGTLVGPFAGLVLVLLTLLVWLPDEPVDWWADVQQTAARCGVLLLALTPMAWHAWRGVAGRSLSAEAQAE